MEKPMWQIGKVGRWVLQRGMYFACETLGGEGLTDEFTYSPYTEDYALVPGFVWMGTDVVDCFGD